MEGAMWWCEELILRRGRGELRKRSGKPPCTPENSRGLYSDATTISTVKYAGTSMETMTSKECGSTGARFGVCAERWCSIRFTLCECRMSTSPRSSIQTFFEPFVWQPRSQTVYQNPKRALIKCTKWSLWGLRDG